MVVDDDSNILDFLVKVLGNDYFVISTDSGSQALNLLRNNDPDLVVSDIMMADIDGIELCRRIKNDFHKPYPCDLTHGSDWRKL